MFSLIQTKVIKSIQFGIWSPEEIKKMSVCRVHNPKKMIGPGTVYDEAMGASVETQEPCVTCGLKPQKCPGHFGYIEFNEPILHPLYIKYVPIFLRCFCKNCFRLIIDKDQVQLWGFMAYKKERRFTRIQERIEKIDVCFHCKSPQPKVNFKPKEGTISLEYKKRQNSDKQSITLSVLEIKRIFDNIIDDDIRLIGFEPQFIHPRSLVMTVFPVPPPCVRPAIYAEGNICYDDLTIQIVEILKDINKISKAKESKDIEKYEKAINSLKFHVSTFYDNSSGKAVHPNDKQPIKCLKSRLAGKKGQIRLNHMGKRVNYSARTVIGPDPTLKVGQIGVPEKIANNLTVPEKVSTYNYEYLSNVVNQGKANFVLRDDKRINLKYALFRQGTELLYGDTIVRGDTKMYENDDGTVSTEEGVTVITGKEKLNPGDQVIRNGELLKDVRYGQQRKFKLKIGDVVERRLKNGDVVLLNRQPTLHKGSMLSMNCVIRPQKTFTLCLPITKTFNADFDGDEMNLHAPQSYETQTELSILSDPKANMISPQESKPNIVIVQDNLLGAYLMTNVDVDGKEVVQAVKVKRSDFQNISLAGTTSDGKMLWSPAKMKHIHRIMKRFGHNDRVFSGHGLISLLLPNDFYYEKENKVNPYEPVIKIYQGVMYEGTLNKAVLGSTHDSIIQALYKNYNSDIASNFVDNLQFITNNWLAIHGFSIGLEDCMLPNSDKARTIKKTLAEYYMKAKGIEETTLNPGIREVRITATLSQAKDVGMRIAKDAMQKSNNFLSTTRGGSKGDFFNIAQSTGLCGQQNIEGERVKYKLNHGKRSLPHYPFEIKNDERKYESKGFIRHSFIHGLNPHEFIFHAMSGRVGICDTAMSTQFSGYNQRKIVKLCEDVQIQYDGSVRDTMGKVYQFAYGETGWDASQTINVNGKSEICDISSIVNQLNCEYEETLN